MLPRSLICLMIAIATAACGNGRPPTPSPPGTGGETITGRERIGWEQPASSTSELATFRYAVYVDGARAEISGTSCAPTAGASGFACSGALPPMAPGAHTLELAAFYESGGIVESAKSAPLRVTVTGSTSPVDATPLQPGDVVTTSDGVRLTAELLVSGLEDLVDVAVAPGGRLVIAERAGRVRIVSGDIVLEALAAGGGSPTRLRQGYGEFAEALRAEAKGLRYASPDGGLLSLALDPNFSDTGHLFVVHAAGDVFRLIRYRLADDRLIDRMAVIRDVPASADPSAAVRFGPDGKLYVAFDDGGSRDASARMSEWTGKILRLNPDGRTPDDQPAASPVFWAGLRSTWGLDWTTEDGTLWIAEQGPDGLERIRALVAGAERPRRAVQRASYVLPRPLGARGMAFYRGDEIRQFAGDLFLAGRDAGYLLRVRFDPSDPLRAMSSERLLEGRIGEVRAVAVADGALYVASATGVWRLSLEGTEDTGRD
ncbi:MAG: PQQ-dependent sugar dehydrogenase [Vicinamibacterales bacterium]